VNAHRGAIFSMGLIVAATARAMTLSISIGPDSIRAALKHAWGDALEAHANRGMTTVSHGALVRRTTGRDGARREAALAFPSVFDVGLPALHQALAAGLDPNAAHIHTLFVLMAAVDDTTVLYRGGVDAGAFVRQSAAAFLADGGCFRPEWHEKAVRLHRTFTDRNLSAGGCADLLACTILLSNCCGPNNFGA
jgi:triphosphoribosyl-dephospho-CoA synthase